jgi:imidazolonepropionase-like amidohydrolase
MKSLFSHLLLLVMLVPTLQAQTARQTGLRDNSPKVFAFTGATIVTAPGHSMEEATLVVRDGIIEAVGRRVDIPTDAHVTDLSGKTIYPGFIDLYAPYGIAPLPQGGAETRAHWNPGVRSFFSAAHAFNPAPEEAAALRSQGFVLAHAVPTQGIFAGQGALVALGDGPAGKMLLEKDVSQVLNASRTGRFPRGYPTASMGAYSLIRQTLYDALWHAEARDTYLAGPQGMRRPERNPALEALHASLKGEKAFLFEAADEQWLLRAADLAGEFSLRLWVVGSGFEYRRADAVAATGLPLILPLDFPAPPEVDSPESGMQVSLEDLRHWYLAPENPGRLAARGVQFGLTSPSGDNKSGFLANLKLAVKRGLKEQDALAALTTTPAELLGISKRYGTLERGKAASFIIASGNLFSGEGDIEHVWVEGTRYPVKPPQADLAGRWTLEGEGLPEGLLLVVEGSPARPRGTMRSGEKSVRLQHIRAGRQRLNFRFLGDSIGMPGIYRFSADMQEGKLVGLAESPSGDFLTWQARLEEAGGRRQGTRPQENPVLAVPERFPSLDYGLTSLPDPVPHLLVRNATLWTQGPAGKLEGADMLVSGGKIVAVGQGLQAPRGAMVIDATGMHVTPGLIDPHLHTSVIGAVNETGDAITSETRIQDVIDANNVWIYRLLAGGLTTAKLFHGSANPIGGQDAVIKMRWGSLPGEMLVEDAAPGLKFALGENVKRSPDRYPNTRMGTEQIIRDAFEAALEYERQWAQWRARPTGLPPRRDLQLEPILEVLKGERQAHVHAYRQDEMLMTMRLAEDFGFTVSTFEHGLEGYKIADELRAHGAAAVVWTDWSSFKVEAYDGILQNARLLHDAGVLTTLHSDNTQLSTRMNWEAAKVMKTGLDEIHALGLITHYPARIMGIDHRVGSLEPGKDADFVIWNGHPLSTFSTASQTWIEGRRYFDREEDLRLREEVRRERALIIQEILRQQATNSQ